MDFSYVLDKIRAADFAESPFRHIEINDLFTREDFASIVSAPEIALKPAKSDDELFDALFDAGFKIIEFPGCITDQQTYVSWHNGKDVGQKHNQSSCEGFGMTLRLIEPKSSAMEQLVAFLNSEVFQSTLAEKFGVAQEGVVYDAGVQKYLDGYEISPHPDIRKKALTYMVNVNPAPNSEALIHHTHYLRFRDQYRYVQSFWSGNEEMDRCWVPWDWCETVSMQPQNNSIVIFAPSNDTLHAVKASYDHLTYQRTQLYGNFWYKKKSPASCPAWEDFVIRQSVSSAQPTWRRRLVDALPSPVAATLRQGLARVRSQKGVQKRFYQQ